MDVQLKYTGYYEKLHYLLPDILNGYVGDPHDYLWWGILIETVFNRSSIVFYFNTSFLGFNRVDAQKEIKQSHPSGVQYA